MDRRQRNAALLVALAAVAVLVGAAPLAGGVIGALVLAAVLERPREWLTARVGPASAATLLLVASALAMFVPAIAIGHAAVSQLRDIDLHTGDGLSALASLLGRGGQDAGGAVDKLGGALSGSVTSIAAALVGTIGHGLSNAVIGLLCLYFVLLGGDESWHSLRRYLPFSAPTADLLRGNLHRVTRATLLGTLLSALLQGISVALGFLLAGAPAAVLWGVIGGFASMVPMIGTGLVWVPATLLMVARQDTTGVLLMVVFGWLIPTVIDKVVRTRIARRFGQIHPLVTLIGAIIGVRLFGMIGIIAGPLTIMTFFELLRAYERDYGAAGAGDVGADAVNVPATGLAPEQRLSHSESAP